MLLIQHLNQSARSGKSKAFPIMPFAVVVSKTNCNAWLHLATYHKETQYVLLYEEQSQEGFHCKI